MECVHRSYLFLYPMVLTLYLVFFACCIAGAVFTLLLPEVKGRDPDLILAEEIREKRRKMGLDVDVDE